MRCFNVFPTCVCLVWRHVRRIRQRSTIFQRRLDLRLCGWSCYEADRFRSLRKCRVCGVRQQWRSRDSKMGVQRVWERKSPAGFKIKLLVGGRGKLSNDSISLCSTGWKFRLKMLLMSWLVYFTLLCVDTLQPALSCFDVHLLVRFPVLLADRCRLMVRLIHQRHTHIDNTALRTDKSVLLMVGPHAAPWWVTFSMRCALY